MNFFPPPPPRHTTTSAYTVPVFIAGTSNPVAQPEHQHKHEHEMPRRDAVRLPATVGTWISPT